MICAVTSWLLALAAVAQAGPPALDAQLKAEETASLVRGVRVQGDPGRGAVVFHLPQLACVTCHGSPGDVPPLGPDLAHPSKDVAEAHLIESILEPSRVIERGYETVTIATVDGTVRSGLLAEERPDAVVLRDPAQSGQAVTIPRAEIEERGKAGLSVMPPGLVNGLASRQQFLDLVCYLRAIADGGPERAVALRPDAAALAATVAAAETNIDHAGLIAGLGPKNLERGAATYGLICANCHGTEDRPGSMPTSLRFASGTFKNGHDPYSLYRTLTVGHGLMPAQTWMVPKQKYDVIHYIREQYLRRRNPSQYAPVTPAYLAGLPAGTSRGPEPVVDEPWAVMDYGPSLMLTGQVGDEDKPVPNIAYKGIAVRLDPGPGGIARGRLWALYDHDTLRVAGAWDGSGFIDWEGINFNGRHQVHPRNKGRVRLANPVGPGWADPATGSFADPRPLGRDGRPYGPLPPQRARYRGLHHWGDRVILSFSIGGTEVLEMPGSETDPKHPDAPIVTRTLEVGPSPRELLARVAPASDSVALAGDDEAEIIHRDGASLLRLPPSDRTRVVKLLISDGDEGSLRAFAAARPSPEPLSPLTRGGPRRWPEVLRTSAAIGRSDGPFAVDVLTHPEANPWKSRMRFSGFDFFPDGRRAAACDWDGDVWLVAGLDDPDGLLSWQRIASGLFQPLGLKIVDGRIYVGCRDQIAALDDRNGDGEADFIACFNSDHQVTEHFHEFAMDLQSDAAGNLYYAKGARHGLPAVVPQHGTLLKVGADGRRTEILATGFRAPNGVCLNPDGTFFMTDQEGHWIPKNRINWVHTGGFYGNMWGFTGVTDPSDNAMEPPVCWITNTMDRSPSEVVRVPSGTWGPLGGSLLSLSYGYGKVFVVPHEMVEDRMQGGVCALPIPRLPTGLVRGRFGPADGSFYACGLVGWASDQTQPGGFYRIRSTGRPMYTPIGLHAQPRGLSITFTEPLGPSAAVAANYAVRVWGLVRSQEYGSDHVEEKPLEVRRAALSDDRRTVLLEIPDLRPSRGMEVKYAVSVADGTAVSGTIHNTIHRLARPDSSGTAGSSTARPGG